MYGGGFVPWPNLTGSTRPDRANGHFLTLFSHFKKLQCYLSPPQTHKQVLCPYAMKINCIVFYLQNDGSIKFIFLHIFYFLSSHDSFFPRIYAHVGTYIIFFWFDDEQKFPATLFARRHPAGGAPEAPDPHRAAPSPPPTDKNSGEEKFWAQSRFFRWRTTSKEPIRQPDLN